MYNDIGEVEINLKISFLELGYERILIIRVGLFLLVCKVFLVDNYSIFLLSEKVVDVYMYNLLERMEKVKDYI